MRVRLMLLGVEGRPAAAGGCMPAIAADMNTERQTQLLRLGIDRPVAMTAERLIGARRDIDLHVAAGFRAAIDFGDGGGGIVLPDQDRGFQPRIAIAPVRELPVVDRTLDRGAKVE